MKKITRLRLPAEAISRRLAVMLLFVLASLFSSVSYAQPCSLSVTLTKVNPTCNGDCDGSMMAMPGGGSGMYTYLWSNGETTQSITGLCADTYTVTVTDSSTQCVEVATSSILKGKVGGNVVVTEPTCQLCNGSMTVQGNGGNGAPYTYVWSTGATTATIDSLCPGVSYTVTITDKEGCTFVCTKTTGNSGSGGFNLNPVVMNDSSCTAPCSGSIMLSPSPAGNYTYQWNTGASTAMIDELCAGTYTVSVTASGNCTVTQTFTIISVATGSFDLNPVVMDDTSCAGICSGSIMLNPSPAGQYTYLWSNGATTSMIDEVCAGTYVVSVTNASGCVTTESISVGSSATGAFDLNPVVMDDSSCAAPCTGAIMLNPSPSGNYMYLWNTGHTTDMIDSLCAGVYTVTVTGGTCTVTASYVITNTATGTFPLNAAIVDDSSCTAPCTGSITLDPPQGDTYSYVWSTGDTTSSISALCAGDYTVTVTSAGGCTVSEIITILNIGAGGFDLNPVVMNDSSCSGSCTGSIMLSPPPIAAYTYLWSNGATTSMIDELCDGDYTVTVAIPGGCSQTATFTIINTAGASFTLNPVIANDTSCTGPCSGSVELNPDPAGNYTYEWSNGNTSAMADELCAGVYTVTVTNDAGCSLSATYTILSTATGSFDLNPIVLDDTSCSSLCSGSIELNPTPGGIYTYLWSDGQTGNIVTDLCAGTYTVTVIPATGCSITETFTVNNIGTGIIALNAILMNDTSCSEPCSGSIMLDPTPAGTYFYEWSNGALDATIEELCSGSYTVTVTSAGGCSYTESFNIDNTASGGFTVNEFIIPDTSCSQPCSGAISITPDPSGAYTYLWSNGNTSDFVEFLCAGDYTVTVTSSAGCTYVETFNVPDSSDCDESAARPASAYPNPFNESITIDTKNHSNLTVTITDVTGRVMETLYDVSGRVEVKSGFTKGIYLIKLENPVTGFQQTIRAICSQ